jgi:thiol:disulfide interchange protein DsbA
MIKKILFLFTIFTSVIYAEEKFTEGTDYELMNSEPSSYVLNKKRKILVVEAFWYGCPHCYVFEGHLSKWKEKNADDVNFINMPVVFNKPWLLHARAFYTMQELENPKELHKNFFIAYHEQGRTFPTIDSILNFLDSQGANIDRAKLIISSKKVSKKVQEANYLLESYKIDSVPAIIINNKYRISGKMAKTYSRMLEISEYIIDLERASRIK